MKQSMLFKLSFCVVIMLIYLFLYDQSTSNFINSIKKLGDLEVSFNSIYCIVVWILGFLGLVTLANLKGKKEKFFFWTVFLLSYAINFTFLKIFGQNFNIKNIHLTVNILDEFNKIHTLDFLKFLIVNIVIFSLIFYIGPLGIDLNKKFMCTLIGLSVLSTLLYGHEKTMPMQSFYTVPFVIMGGMLTKSWFWVKIKLGLKFV